MSPEAQLARFVCTLQSRAFVDALKQLERLDDARRLATLLVV